MKKNEAFGQMGEDRIAAALRDIPDTRLLRNLYIPYGRGTFEIDALVVSRKGLLVIECKTWDGVAIRGSARFGDWSVRSSWKAKPVKRYSPLRQNAAHVRKLARYLQLAPDKTPHSIIVFASVRPKLYAPPNTREYTILQGTSILRSTVMRRLKYRRDVFSDEEIDAIIRRLSATPKPSTQLKETHVKRAREAERKRRIEQEKRRQARRKTKPKAKSKPRKPISKPSPTT